MIAIVFLSMSQGTDQKSYFHNAASIFFSRDHLLTKVYLNSPYENIVPTLNDT